MPNRPRQCTHIKAAGRRCGSPAMRREFFCYFHTRVIKGVQLRVDMQLHSMALLEDAEAIQLSLMHMADALIKGTIDPVRARLLIQVLRIAARNIKAVRFDSRDYGTHNERVREVPNYAEQYLLEHPELDTNAARVKSDVEMAEAHVGTAAPGCPAEQSSAAVAIKPDAEATPPANQAPIQSPPAHAAAERRQNPAHGASRGTESETNPAPEERKKHNPEHKFPPASEDEKERKQLAQVEAAIAGAERGNWKDLKTVLEFAGIAPVKEKEPALQDEALT